MRPCKEQHELSPDTCQWCWWCLSDSEPGRNFRKLWDEPEPEGTGCIGTGCTPTPQNEQRRLRPVEQRRPCDCKKKDDTIQVITDANGVGDAILGLSTCEGLRRQGKHVVLVAKAWAVPWLRLFGGYDELRTAEMADVPSCRPYATYGAQNATKLAKPRWQWYADACRTTAVLPPILPPPAADVKWAEQYRGCVVLSPWSHYQMRQWLLPNWLALEAELHRRGIPTVVLDDQTGRSQVFRGHKVFGESPARVTAVIDVARCVVGGDSGMCHVSGARGVQTIVVCGPVDGKKIFGLYPRVKVLNGRLPCAGCNWQPAAGYQAICNTVCAALQGIRPDDVLAAIQDTPARAITVAFPHGLGDAANYAHMIPLYTARGYQIAVACTPDKECMFKAAGATIAKSGTYHPWLHPKLPGDLPLPWSGNKSGFNISVPPMPNIGTSADRWQEYTDVQLSLADQYTDEPERIAKLLAELPRPLILFHPQGNTSQQHKGIRHEDQKKVLEGLVERTPGTVIVLDWDRRCYRLSHERVRYLGDDMPMLGLLELAALMDVSSLLIGVDSGPQHFARFTKIPVLGVWSGFHPSHFALPRKLSVHLAPARHNHITRYRRTAYQIVEYDDLTAGILHHAERMLGPRRFLSDVGPDTVMQFLIDKLRTGKDGEWDRHKTFGFCLEKLREIEQPVVAQVGCMRALEDWTAGMSDLILGYFVKHHGGTLDSIDCDGDHLALAKEWTGHLGVRHHLAHSHQWFAKYAGPPIHFLYCDGADLWTPGHEEVTRREVELALPHLAPNALVMFDDSPGLQGKGTLAIPWLLDRGFEIVMSNYQAVLRRP